MRRFLAVTILLLALGAAPTHAAIGSRAFGTPASLTESVTTPHFVVHYTTAAGDANAVTAAAAQTTAANAEAAYAVEVGQWGYPPPADDGDDHTDVYVFAFSGPHSGYAGLAWVLSSGVPYPASIGINARFAANKSVIGHELFHVLQFGIFPVGKWVEEATARWAEHQLGYGADFSYLQHTDAPLDCEDADCPVDAWDGGYNRWLFFGYLSDLYGRDVVRQVFQTARSQYDSTHKLASQAAVIDAVLQQHGSTLTRTFDAFAIANASQSYASAKGSPAVPAAQLSVDAEAATTTVTVDHLAAKYVDFRGSMSSCTSSLLRVRVTMPLGLDSAALVAGSTVTPLTVSGGTASATVPWTGCSKVLLALPNGSLSGSATFAVEAVVGRVLPSVTSGGDPAPTLSLDLPAVVNVLAKKPDFRRGLKGRRTLVLTRLSAQGASLPRHQVLFKR